MAIHEKVQIQIYSQWRGSVFWDLGVALSEMLSKYHPWLRASPVETATGPEGVVVIMKPENKKNSIIATSNSYWTQARKGVSPYNTPYTHYAIARHLTTPFGLVTVNPSVRSWPDLRGKRLNMLYPGSIVMEVFSAVLKFHGIYDEVDKVNLNYVKAKEWLLDGTIDAAEYPFAVGPPVLLPADELAELIAKRPDDVYLISFTMEELEEVAKRTGLPMSLVPIKAGDIQKKLNLKQQKDDLLWVAVEHIWGCDKEMDPEITYEICRILDEHMSEFADYHALCVIAKEWTRECLAKCGVSREFYHRGALRYYDEHGIKMIEPAPIGRVIRPE